MTLTSFETSLVVFIALISIAIAGFLASSRPYNILVESGRQAVTVVRYKPWLFFCTWLIFGIQELAPVAIQYIAWPSGWLPLIPLLLAQAIIIYLLAHIAFRLHRGLVLDEWTPLLPRGRQARRMGLYVVGCWAVIGLLKHPPLPPAPGLDLWRILVMVSYALGFVANIAFAVVGPSASLGERRPLWRSIRTVMREPAAALLLVIGVSLMIGLVMEGLGLAVRLSPDLGMMRLALAPLIWAFMAFVLFMSEFALVIFLTRVWEDLYERDTRSALHNFHWT